MKEVNHTTKSSERKPVLDPFTRQNNSNNNGLPGLAKDSLVQRSVNSKAREYSAKDRGVEVQSNSNLPGGAKDSLIQRSINEQSKDLTLQSKGASESSSKMPSAVQAKMENSFGTDFSDVNIHQGESATQMNALAYTQGNDIHFAPGQYNPESQSGQELLGHELTHVVQQRSGRVQPTTQMKGVGLNEDKGLEKEEKDKTVESQEVVTEEKKEEENKDEKKEINISRGVMQFVSEGEYTGTNDITKPHIPINIYLYQKLTKEEIDAEGKKEAKNKITRYKGPDVNGVFSVDAAGEFKQVKMVDRHSKSTYDAKLETGQQYGAGGISGLTIAFGIDIGNKWGTGDAEKVKKFFTDGGVDTKKAEKLSKAAGLKGLEAAKKTAEIREDVTLTVDETLTLLKKAIPDYDSKGYTRGDDSFHPAIEETLMYAAYWGETNLRTSIIAAAKDKTGTEQFKAARDKVKELYDNMSDKNWKKPGYKAFYCYLQILTEMSEKGYEIKMSDAVLTKDELLDTSKDDTLELVEEITERKENFGLGKDLSTQMGGEALADLITASVGEGGKNNEADIKVVQELLYNGNYDIDINGTYDEKTKTAIQKFMNDEFKKTYKTVDPNGAIMRKMKKFRYLTRNVKEEK